ncbi:CHAT domain-containing protein [Gemmatimonadota bacterium]
MRARITILGSDILCNPDLTRRGRKVRIPLTDEVLSKFEEWAGQYDRAVRSNDPSPLLALGLEMFKWVDEGGWASKWVKGEGDRILEVAVNDPESAAAEALLDIPWEFLAHGGDFLAADPNQTFVVSRIIGRSEDDEPVQALHRDLALMFMAAAPRGERELDFDAEEAAILSATEHLPIQLCVEESGCKDFLKDRLAQEGPFEAVHISCHGNIHEDTGPVLALETPEGDLYHATPGDIAKALGEKKAPLVFLSACRTAESKKVGTGEDKLHTSESFVRALVRAGVPNVLGWDSSVYEYDATLFAKEFYRELAEFATVPYAAAVARREVLREHRNDPQKKGRHWHLARVYMGRQGGGALCDNEKPKRKIRKAAGYKEFLDKAQENVPVATAQTFVGRRRQAQSILRAFRDNEKSGVLIYGMGNIGKSSLAARIANRMPRHSTAVIFERYDALAIFERLLAAIPGRERQKWENEWGEAIAAKGQSLGDALEEMLKGPFDENPILLIIDDLEQVLETPMPDQIATPVRDVEGEADAWRIALGSVIRAFGAVADTESRLLLTSRYLFTLPDGQRHDLAEELEHIQLRPMEDREREKQWQAAKRTEKDKGLKLKGDERELVARALNVAGGNPGLQEILCRPILSGELKVASKALDTVEGWKASGKLPSEESAAQEFFQRVSLETYRDALTEPQETQLRAATVFSEGVPVPVPALEAVGRAAGIADPLAAMDRLIGLGLVDQWGEIGGVEHAAANPLARPLVKSELTDKEQEHLAASAITPLTESWLNEDGDFPIDQRSLEVTRLAFNGGAPTEVLEKAADAAGSFLFRGEHNAGAALAILKQALEKMDEEDWDPNPGFLLLASNCAERIGEMEQRISLLERGLELKSDDKVGLAQLKATHAEATISRKGPEKALETLREAVILFEQAGEDYSRAVTMGKISNILERLGETDEALRIRREEELPVFERLGEVGEQAKSMGRIADILAQRGETDGALRIHREEGLPVFERLGDVRSRAVAMGKIADILAQRGETDEALRIRREEQLPVFERLGDVRSRAVVMGKIADILAQRDEIDEALRIRREECLPAFEAINDLDCIAHIHYSCAQLRIEQGGLKQGEAQTIHDELQKSFEINLKLKRADGVAYVGVAYGQILSMAGYTDQALAVLELSAEAFENLGHTENAESVRALQKQIREKQNDS